MAGFRPAEGRCEALSLEKRALAKSEAAMVDQCEFVCKGVNKSTIVTSIFFINLRAILQADGLN